MRGNAKSFVVLSFVVVLSAGCERMGSNKSASGRSVAELDAAVAKLENEVRGLERALAEAEASRGRWVLWRTIEFNTVGGGLLAPKPFDAFATKQACVSAAEDAVVEVAKKGEGKQVDATSYQVVFRGIAGADTALVVFRCLPDTVEAAGAKGR